MKALVFLLLLANLLFYAFSEGYFGKTEHPDAERVKNQVVPERMTIVSRGEAPVPPPPALEPPAKLPASPEPVVEPAKPEVPPEKLAKPEETASVCLAWEHLSMIEADQLAALLSGKFASFKASRKIAGGESNGWWVFIPPLAGKAEADKKASELRLFGITDYFIVPDSPSRYAISLGVFSSEKGAQERLAELKEKGVRSARLTPRPSKDSTFTVQATGPASSKANLIAAAARVAPKSGALNCK